MKNTKNTKNTKKARALRLCVPSTLQIQKERAIRQIANDVLGIETLDVQKRDSLDFHERSVWTIREALEAAFAAGLKAAW